MRTQYGDVGLVRTLVPIRRLVDRLEITPRALRHYEALGLIRSERDVRGARVYDLETINLVEMVAALRRVDIPLADIRQVMLLKSSPAVYAEALREILVVALVDKEQMVGEIHRLLGGLETNSPSSRRRGRADRPMGSRPAQWREESLDR